MLTFRKEALQALRSAEDLNEAIRVTSPFSWAFVVTALAAAGIALAWGVLGSIPTRVEGPALISCAGAETSEVVAVESGLLTAVQVKPGDIVAPGQTIATSVNAALRADLDEALRVRDDLARVLADYERQRDAELSEFDNLTNYQRKTLENRLADVRRQAAANEERLRSNEQLKKKGYTTAASLEEVRARVYESRQTIGSIETDLIQFDLTREERVNQWRQRILDQQQRLQQQDGTIGTLRSRLRLAEEIRSPVAGEIDSILAAQGTYLQPGAKIATVVGPPNPGLEVLAFLQPGDAKQIADGMLAQISPSSAPREEFGTVLGRVAEVSQFPLSTDALAALLQNRDLASSFAQRGSPILVRIELERDPDHSLRWSTGQNPPVRISAGTSALASVVVKQQQPIALVLPALRRWSGLP